MDYLQYRGVLDAMEIRNEDEVLNLIINGLPSIPVGHDVDTSYVGFKPYYKWITFNTYEFLRSHKSFCRF